MKPWILAFFPVMALLQAPAGATAQLAIGGHVTVSDLDLDGATWGLGGRAVLGVPLTGIGAQATLDVFDWDCGSEDCRSQVLGLDLLYAFPGPFVMNPYVGGGVSVDATEDFDFEWDLGEVDWHLVGGVVLGGASFPRIRPFVEGKYEIGEGGTLFSAGVLIHLF